MRPNRHRLLVATAVLALAASTARAQQPPAAPSAPLAIVSPPAATPEEVDAPPILKTGLGDGVTVTTADNSFSMTLRGRAEVRGTMVVDPDAEHDQPASELVIRRSRLVLLGHFYEKSWQYYIQFAFSNQDQEPDLRTPLLDAYLTWSKVRDVNVRVGQMMLPQGRHRVASSSAQQLVDRAPVVSELNIDRDVGVQLLSTDLFGLGHKLGYNLGVFGGDGRNRQSSTYGLHYVGRLELTPFGKFEDAYTEGDLTRSDRPRLAVGVSGAYNQHTNRPRSTVGVPYQGARFDYLNLGVDAVFKWKGLSVLAEVLLRTADEDARTTTIDGMDVQEFSRSGWGWLAQAGYMVTDHVDVAARYSDFHPAEGTDPTLSRMREAAVGTNYYFQGHKFKLQADQAYVFGDDADTGIHRTRLQLEFYF